LFFTGPFWPSLSPKPVRDGNPSTYTPKVLDPISSQKKKLHSNWMENKKVIILEFGFSWPLSVEFISETI